MRKFRFLLIIFTMFSCLIACNSKSKTDSIATSKTLYSITIDEELKEWISVEKTSASESEIVTITIKNPKGKLLNLEVLLFSNENETDYLPLQLEKVNYSKYTFTMPKENVKITGYLRDTAPMIYSLEIDGTKLKWDAYALENYRFEIKVFLLGYEDGTPVSYFIASYDRFELDLKDLFYSKYVGKYIEVELTLERVKDWFSDTVDSCRIQTILKDENLPTLNTPTDLKIEDNILTWKWNDLDNEFGNFILTINDVNMILSIPFFDLSINPIDEIKSISVCVQGVSEKSNASEKISLNFKDDTPVYNITFYINDGTEDSKTFKSTDLKISEHVPLRTGYAFNGWYTSNNDGRELRKLYSDDDLITSNLELYAEWLKIDSVTGIKSLPTPKLFMYGSCVYWLSIPQKNGYYFEITMDDEVIDSGIISENKLDLSLYIKDNKTVTVKVKTKGDGIVNNDSDYSTIRVNPAYELSNFISSMNVDYNVGAAYWILDYTDYYNLFTFNLYDLKTGLKVSYYSSHHPKFVFRSIPAGKYKLEILLENSNSEIITEIITEFEILRLTSPVISFSKTGDNWHVSWEKINYANQYEVIINGVKHNVTDDFIDIPISNDKLEVAVRAKDTNNKYIVSEFKKIIIEKSDTVKIIYPNEGTYVFIDDDEYTMNYRDLYDNIKLIFNGKKIYFPDNFRSFDPSIIKYSPNLEEIEIENFDSVNSIESLFTNFEVPKSLKIITINQGPNTIYSSFFINMTNIETINLGIGITEFGDNAFIDCISLHTINVKENLTSLTLKSFNTNSPIVILDEGGYYLNLNNNPHYIYLARSNNGKLKINEDTKIIASYAFENFKMLEEDLILPDGLISILKFAFRDNRITSVYLPNTLKNIGYGAFYGCKKLKSVRIPESVTEIYNHTFYNCSSLINLYLHDKITKFGENSINSNVNQITIQGEIKYLGTDTNPYLIAYSINNNKLKEIIINENCVVLKDRLFYNQYSLRKLEIPESVKYYGSNLFVFCSMLNEITISKNAILDKDVFDGCSFERVYFTGTVREWNTINGQMDDNSSGDIRIICSDGEIII